MVNEAIVIKKYYFELETTFFFNLYSKVKLTQKIIATKVTYLKTNHKVSNGESFIDRKDQKQGQ